MPIGTSKLGVLGAGVVPGGTQTFNTPGTFTVPPGVTKVSITGRGGTGNPGNAGNSGNAGNPGTGGGGGGAGRSSLGSPYGCCFSLRAGGRGGAALKGVNGPYGFYVAPTTPMVPCSIPAPLAPRFVAGGTGESELPVPSGGTNANPGGSGISGNAGSAGNAGNPGNPGNSSSGLSQTFPGGAGGNAGVAGAAGNGGSGGGGGSAGGGQNNRAGGAGGTGGGSGASGSTAPTPPLPLNNPIWGGGGGGGAGVTNSGQNGFPSGAGSPQPVAVFARGGTWPCYSAPFGGPPISPAQLNPCRAYPAPTGTPTNLTGGCGGYSTGYSAITMTPVLPYPNRNPGRRDESNFSPSPVPFQLYRSGAGGGGGGIFSCRGPGNDGYTYKTGGGGGGGGRGAVGNAGGASPTPSGSAATPSTVNCVSVTPGSPYPITVASPGGQIVISWNPQ